MNIADFAKHVDELKARGAAVVTLSIAEAEALIRATPIAEDRGPYPLPRLWPQAHRVSA